MSNFTYTHLRSPLRVYLTALIAILMLAGCGSDKPKEDKKKDDRTPQERVLVLKQRFDQLESSLHEMKQDLEIHKKRIESTQKIVDSIKHSLLKGGLKGYSLGNISTTDPLVLAALSEQQTKKQDKEAREAEKEETDNTILNALLIACFVVFIIAIFVAALKDKKTVEPIEPAVWPEPSDTEDKPVLPTEDGSPEAQETESYEYGELRPPVKRTDTEDTEMNEDRDDRPR